MPADYQNSIAVLEEPGGLETVLISAGALALITEIRAAAEMMNLEAGAFAGLAVRRFFERASDEDWASLTSAANANDDALGSITVQILRKAVTDAKAVCQ